jgi:DNA polymerase III subunit delta'
VSDTVNVDVWGDVVGQPRAEADLRAAAASPVHAYLFLGPTGSGRRAAARAFAADLFSRHRASGAGDDADGERQARLALEGKHPDLQVFEPEGARLRMKEKIPAVIREANRAPVEAAHKVLVLTEFHRMEDYAAALLKTIEEPPASTIFVIVADELPPELVTIASRAVRIDFGPVPTAAVVERLLAEGIEPDRAAEAAAAAAGDLARARLLATDDELAARRAAWWAVPEALDGTGATVVRLVNDLRARIDAAQGPVDHRHREERAGLEAEVERYGLRRSVLKEQEEHHKREARRLRTQELRFGLATLAGRYRDELATAPDPTPLAASLQAIQATADDLIRNPTEDLALLGLLLRLRPL